MLGRRIGAALIDLALMFVLFLLTGIALGEGESGENGVSVSLEGAEFVLFLALMLLYYFAAELRWGQTVGKRLLGLRVSARDGSDPSAGQVAARTALRLVDILPALYLVGFIVMLVSSAHQRVGDLAAGTVVLRSESSTPHRQ